MRKINAISLFCGCGGIDVGIKGGFDFLGKHYKKFNTNIVHASDIDEKIVDLYNSNFSDKAAVEDITKLNIQTIPDHDILLGGFPCQSFSIVAQNPPRLGYKDTKGQLFFEMCKILKEKQPKCFIAENVKGILSANNKKAFPLIIKNFEDVGYYVTYKLLNASHYGVPQKRERVFIVGFKNKADFDNFDFPEAITEEFPTPLIDVIFPESDIPEKYYFSEKAVAGMLKVKDKMNKGRAQNPEMPCNTVGAHLAKVSLNSTDPVLCINGRYRRFTPREVARIQSFPDNYKLNGSQTTMYKALGNAVPPVLMWHVYHKVYNILYKTLSNEKNNQTADKV